MATEPARYIKVTTGTAQPAPGGLGMVALSSTVIRLALSKIDADGTTHLDLETVDPGAVIQIDDENANTHYVTCDPGYPVAHDYYYDIYGTTADPAACAGMTGDLFVWLPATDTEPADVWLSGSAILTHLGVTSPTPEDQIWADECAAAVTVAWIEILRGSKRANPQNMELRTQALRTGSELYKSREAPFGVTGYADLTGAAIRLARDPNEAAWPVLRRYATPGIG